MKKTFSVLQKVGSSLMLPVSVLPAAGLLLRLGQDDLLGKYGKIFKLLAIGGDVVFANLPLIFAVGVAIGFSGGEGVAALSAVVGHVIFQGVLKQASVGLQSQMDAGVFGGIIIGLMSALLYKKFHSMALPQILGFFSGKRFVPIITSLCALLCAAAFSTIWPQVQAVIDEFARTASHSPLGPAFYASGKRLLIPVGLHHMYYPPFLFQFGKFTADGVAYVGDSARYFHGDPTAGVFMASEYPIIMFGLPGAALAMISAAKPENRKKVSGMMLSAALVSFLTGITEPIEFSFIFAAPLLFVFHVLAAFMSGVITSVMNIRLGYTFSASFIDYVLGFKFAGRPLMIWVVGACYFAVYYVVFYSVIKTFDYKTPGREDAEATVETKQKRASERALVVLDAVGGNENILSMDACITRLRMSLKDSRLLDREALKLAGCSGVLQAGNNVQAIFGTDVERILEEMNAIIANGGMYDQDFIGNADKSIESKTNKQFESDEWEFSMGAPMRGSVVELSMVPDEVFADKLLGDGFAIVPDGSEVFAPCDGVVEVMFPTKHALAIRTEQGMEILIHIGVDTVNLKGEGFETHVKQGDQVKKGCLLLTFNEKLVSENATSLVSPVIVTNMQMIEKLSISYGFKNQNDNVMNVRLK